MIFAKESEFEEEFLDSLITLHQRKLNLPRGLKESAA